MENGVITMVAFIAQQTLMQKQNASAISASIIEMKLHGVSREDYDAAMMRNDELETEKAMLQFKNRELQEELNSYKERFDRCYSALVG